MIDMLPLLHNSLNIVFYTLLPAVFVSSVLYCAMIRNYAASALAITIISVASWIIAVTLSYYAGMAGVQIATQDDLVNLLSGYLAWVNPYLTAEMEFIVPDAAISEMTRLALFVFLAAYTAKIALGLFTKFIMMAYRITVESNAAKSMNDFRHHTNPTRNAPVARPVSGRADTGERT